jgi:hypothetical protein
VREELMQTFVIQLRFLGLKCVPKIRDGLISGIKKPC